MPLWCDLPVRQRLHVRAVERERMCRVHVGRGTRHQGVRVLTAKRRRLAIRHPPVNHEQPPHPHAIQDFGQSERLG
jgi:hypothetical protein